MGINIDNMLTAEARLLAQDAQVMEAKAFVELASKEQLRQKDWTLFWKLVRSFKLN